MKAICINAEYANGNSNDIHRGTGAKQFLQFKIYEYEEEITPNYKGLKRYNQKVYYIHDEVCIKYPNCNPIILVERFFSQCFIKIP
jgi:hypothetical protein